MDVTELRRLEALHRYQVLDTPPEDSFDAIVRLAARICNTPTALIVLVDEARQWFKARVGWDYADTPREIAFCSHTVEDKQFSVIPDALADVRFRDNPLVTAEPQIRFYAGVPLITDEGYAIGTLCVIDREPRPGLDPDQHECLQLLANETVTQLELRRASIELAEAKSALEAASVEQQAFSAAIAHDLRAPIRHIDGFVQMLADRFTDDADALALTSRIRQACFSMRNIIDSLLRLSQISHAELHRQSVDLGAIAREICSELQAAEPTRRVQCVIADNITASADPGLIRLVLANLLSNAWKFTRDAQGARIEFGTRGNPPEGEYFVADNGVGIDPRTILLPPRPFVRHHSAQGYEGVGLGLTIIDRIIKRHGGSLRVEGNADRGSTFLFTIPTRRTH